MNFKKLKEKIAEISRINKMIALMVTLMLIGWGIVVVFFTQKDIGTEKAANEVSRLANNIRRYYQNRPDFWGLNTKTVIEKAIAPRVMIKEGVLKSYYNTEVLVGSGAEGNVLMPGAKSFDIVYINLNKQECEELASYRFDDKFWLGVMSVSLNNGEETKVFNWIDKNLLPIKKEQARNICKKKNTLIWHYE